MSRPCSSLVIAAVLAIGLFTATAVPQVLPRNGRKFSTLQVKAGDTQPSVHSEVFPCTNPKMQAPRNPPSKHSVTLSWKAPVSSVGGDDKAAYNLYRLNPDSSCTRVNDQPIQQMVYVDHFVEPGKTYRYAAKAINRAQIESGPSNVVEVTIPRM